MGEDRPPKALTGIPGADTRRRFVLGSAAKRLTIMIRYGVLLRASLCVPNLACSTRSTGRDRRATMSRRAELRSTRDNIVTLARMSERLINGQRELTREQSLEFGRALNDIAERLERAADVLARLMQLSNPETTLQNVHLTPREMEIFGYLADGQTNGEIASRCWVSENTVKFHLKNIFRKLDIRDRGQAMMVAKGLRHSIGTAEPRDGPAE